MASFNSVLLRVCVLLVCFAFIILILMGNISLRKKVQIDREQYRTLVHHAVKEAIEAEEIREHDPVHALLKLTVAQTKIATTVQLVGGIANLQLLSGGLDIALITNTMTFHERQLRATIAQRGFMNQHALSEFTQERYVQRPSVEQSRRLSTESALYDPPLSPTALLPSLQID